LVFDLIDGLLMAGVRGAFLVSFVAADRDWQGCVGICSRGTGGEVMAVVGGRSSLTTAGVTTTRFRLQPGARTPPARPGGGRRRLIYVLM
jgi:hypothetical protein